MRSDIYISNKKRRKDDEGYEVVGEERARGKEGYEVGGERESEGKGGILKVIGRLLQQ